MEKNSSAKFSFYYLLSLVALLFTSISVGIVIFQTINKYVTDVLNQYSGTFSQDALKFAISALIIAAPIFFVTTRLIYKSLVNGNLDKDSAVRRWLTYFVLLVSAVVMIVWLITTINSYLNGELTLKAILKTITVLAIAASIFSYYLYDIKREVVTDKKDKIVLSYFYATLVVVIGVFIWSLFIVESPTATRNRIMDNNVLNNFDTINNAINDYYYKYKKLPDDLEMLKDTQAYLTNSNLQDPATKVRFDYKIKSGNEYELCATFKASNKNQTDMSYVYLKDRWPHDAGYQCLSQKVTDIKGAVENKAVNPIQ
ncbi:MAG: hypothetical protein BWY51_00472 [Parcubacteria group bacterium ADurb.Bin316]|nr:MAG: hypothetical protein BWY51_00472 [Parcubacteria group bacterium ADurb.Bin316]HOZ56092.1 DUF5671 domain-containing protein [bacterium]